MPADVDWDPWVWEDINQAVVAEVAKVRVADKVFPTTVFDTNPTGVPDDVIKFGHPLTISEGRTKPFLEIYQEFSLSAAQVAKEPQLKTAKALARMAAKAIAVAADTALFQGKKGTLPEDVKIEPETIPDDGLVGVAKPTTTDGTPDTSDTEAGKVSEPIEVFYRKGERPPNWGENLFSAVVTGITKLTANKAQAPQYALLLPVDAYADAFVPPSNASLVTTAERIRPLVLGGFYGTGTLPVAKEAHRGAVAKPGLGLLVALGGDPTTLYVGREAQAEFVRHVGAAYIFRVVERVQFVARDPRAFVLLNLNPALPPRTAIFVKPPRTTLKKGATLQLEVTDSNNVDVTETATYASDSPKVEALATGLVTGKDDVAGAKVTATLQDKSAICTVTVVP